MKKLLKTNIFAHSSERKPLKKISDKILLDYNVIYVLKKRQTQHFGLHMFSLMFNFRYGFVNFDRCMLQFLCVTGYTRYF